MCSLPSYPGVGGHGPVVLTYLEDQRVLAACGSYYVYGDQSCYQLSPDQPTAWTPLPGDLLNDHCPYPWATRSHYLEHHGWLIVGKEPQDGHCSNRIDAMNSELLTLQLQWTQTRITSPYHGGYPGNTCSVAVNSSTVIVAGGYNGYGRLSSTWMLDMEDYTWTPLQDMPGPRYYHGCTKTSTGELIIAGGFDGVSYLSSVYIYNLMTNTWSQVDDLPAGMEQYIPVMFLWNRHPIILESFTSNIWILEEGEWQMMETNLGAKFMGDEDLASIVPSSLFSCV